MRGVEIYCRDGLVGDYIVLMVAPPFPLFCLTPLKSENGNCEGCTKEN